MADRVRLSLYCPTCLPGYHVPFFAAVVNGVFADFDLLVEILDPPPPPGQNNTHRVAGGEADFCVTGVTYFLLAQKEAGDYLPARFVAPLHQRSPLGAVVPAESDMSAPEDLGGKRIARGDYTFWLTDECIQALDDRGLDVPVPVRVAHGEGPFALGQGDVDIVPCFIDGKSRVGIRGKLPVRHIHVGADIYASGLVAADGVSSDVVERMRAAVAVAFSLDGDELTTGIADYCERYPDVDPTTAAESFGVLRSYVQSPEGVGVMNHERWGTTLAWIERAHGLPPVDPARVYRPELASG